MVFNCFEQVAHLSEAFTLEPGDVIATGTPAGIGAVRQPFPEGLLKVGDVVRIEIEGIGESDQHDRGGAGGLRRAGDRGVPRMDELTPSYESSSTPTAWACWRRSPSDGRPRQSLVYYARDGNGC